MKKIIALDFDGVLHPKRPSSSSAMFQGLEVLSKAIEGVTDLYIVIDSTWRRYPSGLE
jgi:hypothetical protein